MLIPHLSGCSAPDSLHIYNTAQETFISTMKVSLHLRDTGKISKTDWESKYAVVIRFIDEKMDEAKLLAFAGDKENTKKLVSVIGREITRLEGWNNERNSSSNNDSRSSDKTGTSQ